MMSKSFFSEIKKCVRGKVLCNEPMARHASFRIGGPAEIWVEPEDAEDLSACVVIAKNNDVPVFIIGAGTNLLIKDGGVKGVVINMASCGMKSIYHGKIKSAATSAVKLQEFIKSCADNDLCGLEFLAGVPGTIGGAVRMNAGTRHHEKKDARLEIGSFVEEVRVMDAGGNFTVLSAAEINFGYRSSGLRDLIITEVKFRLVKDERGSILGRYNHFLKWKKMTQEMSRPSAGCIFKNPRGREMSAGEMIDRCGLKGRRAGGALISKKHANFIVNTGGATFDDVAELIDAARSAVKAEFGVELELEIEIV